MRTTFFLVLLSLAILSFSAPSQNKALDDTKREMKLKVGATKEQADSGTEDKIELWAVVIGISRYKYGDQEMAGCEIPNLKNAAEDAQAVYDFLRSPEGGGFRDESEGGHMTLLKDEEATKSNIEKAISNLKNAKPDDYFVLYISGHGALLPTRDVTMNRTIDVPYFILHDTNLQDPKNTALRMDTFRKIVSEIPARKGLVLSDTCHSGGVQLAGRDLSFTTIRANNTFLEEMKEIPSGVGFISASEQLEQALERDELNQGVFTYCLLNGLSGIADKDNDGKVTFDEIVSYLRDEVPKWTNDRQHPHYNTTAIEANYLPLSVVSSVDEKGDGMIAVRTPDLDGVEVGFDSSPVHLVLNNRIQRRIKLKSGMRVLTFSKGVMRRVLNTMVEPGRSKNIEVNLSFSESDEDELETSSRNQVNVYLREDKEPSKEARDSFQKGVDFFNKQKFDEAVEIFNKAVQINGGGYVDALVYKGRAEQSLNRNEAAVQSFKAALAARPTDFETQTLLAEAKFMAGYNVEEVADELKSIIRRHPNFDFARVVYGDVLLLRREPMLAEQQLRRAITLNPKYPPAHLVLADVLTYQGLKQKQRQAVEESKKALQLFEELAKKQVSAARGLKFMSLNHIVFGGGRYISDRVMAEAQHMVAKTLTRYVERDESLQERDELLSQARVSIQEAMKYATRLTDKRQLALILATSAQNYLLKENIALAIADAQSALKIGETIPDLKDYPDAHYTLYSAYVSDQKYAKGIEELEKFMEVAGAQLSSSERQEYEEELRRLKRLKEGNRQKK